MLVEKDSVPRFPKFVATFSFIEIFFLKTFFQPKFLKMIKRVNLNVRVQRISSTRKAQPLQILHGNVLINMLHKYSRGKNVIMTSSILAFSDNAITQKRVFQVAFFLICLMLMTKISYKL